MLVQKVVGGNGYWRRKRLLAVSSLVQRAVGEKGCSCKRSSVKRLLVSYHMSYKQYWLST